MTDQKKKKTQKEGLNSPEIREDFPELHLSLELRMRR